MVSGVRGWMRRAVGVGLLAIAEMVTGAWGTETPRTPGGGPTIAVARPVGAAWRDSPAGARALATEARIAGTRFGAPSRKHFPDELRPPSGRGARRNGPAWTLNAMRAAGPEATAGPDRLPIVCIRVDFQGDSLGSLTSTTDGKFDLRPYVDSHGDTVDVPIDPPPHNKAYFEAHLAALDRYYLAQSHGLAGVRTIVFPAASDSAYHLRDNGQYGPWFLFSGADVYSTAKQFVRDAIKAAAHDPDIPWDDFALPDGSVRVMIFHAGPDLQSDIRGDSPRDLPSFFLTLDDTVQVGDGRHFVDAATVVPESPNQDGEWNALNGVLAHETGHQMGLPDLYNTLYGLPVIGLWSLMDSGNLVAGPTTDRHGNLIYVSGLIPPSLDAWSKAVLWGRTFLRGGFNVSMSDTLPSIETKPWIEEVPISATEYFLLENRQTDINGDDSIFVETDSLTHVVLGPKASRAKDAPPLAEYDALLPGSGVLVWHIDDERAAQLYSLGYSLNDDYARPAVGLMEADGTYDLGDTSVYPYTVGSPNDPYWAGNGDSLTAHTVPSSNLNTGAVSHVSIRVTSPRGPKMAVSARSDRLVPGWPSSAAVDSIAMGSPIVGPFLGDGGTYVAMVSEGFLYVFDHQGNPRRKSRTQDYFASSDDGTEFLPELAWADSALAGTGGARQPIFAATTRNGRLNLFDTRGNYVEPFGELPAFSTAPSFIGRDIVIGGRDGRVYKLSLDGTITALTPSAGAPISATPRSVTLYADANFAQSPQYVDIVTTARNGTLIVLPDATGAQQPVMAHVTDATDWDTSISVWQDVAFGEVRGFVLGDRHGNIWVTSTSGAVQAGWPRALGDSLLGTPLVALLDDTTTPSVIAAGMHGTVMAWTMGGSPKRLWPRDADVSFGDGGYTVASPLLVPRPGAGSWALLGLGSGNLVPRAGTPGARTVRADDVPDGWPLGVTYGIAATPALADLDGDGIVDILLPANDGVLYALSTGLSACTSAAECGAARWWTMEGGNPARTGSRPATLVIRTADVQPPRAHSSALEDLYIAPNPWRLHVGGDLRIGYLLPDGADDVQIDMFDIAGKRIARVAGPHDAGENAAVWSPAALAPGAYLCVVRVRGGGATKSYVQHWAVAP